MKFKYFLILVIVTIITVMTFQSCGSNDEPKLPIEPPVEVYTYNESDSAIFCDIFRIAYNGYSGTIEMENNMRLDSIPTWHPFVSWVKDEENKEYRISSLKIKAWDTDKFYGIISFEVVYLDSLKNLEISGSSIHGYLPSEIGSYDALENLSITGTNMTYIAGRVLNSFNLKNVKITQNYNMELPDLDFISSSGEYYKPRKYMLNDNGFKGSCPMSLKYYVNLSDNDLTEVDWDWMECRDYTQLLKESPRPGPYLTNNPIRTRVPDYILADTLAIIYVSGCLGFGPNRQIDNFPSDDEIYKMKMEWKKNHPEEAEELGL